MVSALGGIKPTRGWIGDVVVSGTAIKSKGFSKAPEMPPVTLTLARRTAPLTMPTGGVGLTPGPLCCPMVYYMQVSQRPDPLLCLPEFHYVW
jgi:hypothetical protein